MWSHDICPSFLHRKHSHSFIYLSCSLIDNLSISILSTSVVFGSLVCGVNVVHGVNVVRGAGLGVHPVILSFHHIL